MLTANYIHQGTAKEPSKAATKRMWKMLEKDLSKADGRVTSRSGWTAAVAINICVTKGWDFKLTARPGFYFLERIKSLDTPTTL